MTPDVTTANLLASSGIANVTSANTFVGPEDSVSPLVPGVANFVVAFRGPPGTLVLGEGGPTLWEVPLVITCRGAPHDPKEPKDRAEAILRFLHRRIPDGSVGFLSIVPFPTAQGQNALAAYRWQVDVMARIEE